MLLFLLLGSLGNMIHWKICIGDMPNDEGTMIIRGPHNVERKKLSNIMSRLLEKLRKGKMCVLGGEGRGVDGTSAKVMSW